MEKSNHEILTSHFKSRSQKRQRRDQFQRWPNIPQQLFLPNGRRLQLQKLCSGWLFHTNNAPLSAQHLYKHDR
ncbi:hypothetical protein K443DRAFT_377323 [Laccaria amethystina LaAM-08-1]|uniref:Unplaced genomic scaffold K443scaffold_286, whole genome shotgun sequence n=1 Tax=Laccaria amethystina LaAM-08-1 TaxID=1095629 RepID=A0A0C9WJ03_9AGAR|nr:hypothetical protein K443DRAFT_377323 [Laccaria amethystina LaAM-08-1]